MHRLDEGAARPSRAAAALGTRARVLGERQRQAHRLRDAGLSDDRARRAHRRSRRRLRRRRHRRSQREHRSAARSAERRDRFARDADRREERHHRRRRASDGREPDERAHDEGLRARLRRTHRRAPVDLPHGADARRVRHRELAARLERVHGQHGRVGADLRRRGARDRVPARRAGDRRLLRRRPARRQLVQRDAARRRS